MLVMGAALAGLMATTPVSAATPPEYTLDFSATVPVPPDYCVRLVNGVIHTMDGSNTTVSSVMIQDGKFTVIGPGPSDGALREALVHVERTRADGPAVD